MLMAEFPGRDEVADQLRGATVRDDCVCGCGSFAIVPDESKPKAPIDGVVFEAAGKDQTDNDVGVFIMVRNGLVEYVECWGLTTDPAGLPRPESLSVLDRVALAPDRGRLVPHRRTILEEHGRRKA